MKRLFMLATGGIVALGMAAAVNAAAEGTTPPPKQQGIVNAKKAIQGKLDRDKKIQEKRKQGQAMKKQAQRGA